MKKILTGVFVLTVMYSCNNSATKNSEGKPADSAATSASIAQSGIYEKGLNLVANSDCTTCHQVDVKTTGPAYRDVANKYENNDATVALLAEKVIKGGKGNWGEIPMTPHPQISEADAREMVKYVLSLRNK